MIFDCRLVVDWRLVICDWVRGSMFDALDQQARRHKSTIKNQQSSTNQQSKIPDQQLTD